MTETIHHKPGKAKSFDYGEGFFIKETPEVNETPPIVAATEASKLVGSKALEATFENEYPAYPPISERPFVIMEPSPESLPTPDAHIVLSHEEIMDRHKVLDTLELQHYATMTPSFEEQASDPTRTNIVESYMHASKRSDDMLVATTESEGLRQLRAAIEKQISYGGEYASDLQDMLDNLTFIGEKELTEAVTVIGYMWKDYLEKDGKNILCLGVVDDMDKGKSSPYIVGRVLDTFSDEELEKYNGRIVERPEELIEKGVDPENALIAITDDSTISGRQLRERYRQISMIPGIEPYLRHVNDEDGLGHAYLSSFEIHLVVAQAKILEEGLQTNDGWRSRIRTKACYKAHEVGHEDSVHDGLRSRTTNAHSSVDFGFNWTLLPAFGSEGKMPPLAYVKRQYRQKLPRVTIAPDGSLHRTPPSEAA